MHILKNIFAVLYNVTVQRCSLIKELRPIRERRVFFLFI